MSIRTYLFGETRDRQSTEVRDPRAATQSLTFTSPGVRQMPEWDADSAIREAYLSSVVVYACVQTIAKAVASCDLRAILPGKDVADFDPHAPLARLLGPAPGSPNPNLSARRLWMNATANYIVTGKFAWELEAPQGAQLSQRNWAPVALWPLVARVLEVIPTDGGSTLFSGFRYGRGDRKVDLFPSQVFYTYNPSLNDFRQAGSALQSMRYDIVAEVMQSVYDAAFLRNDARPAGVLVHQAFEEKSQERAWEQQFEANHRSPQNANRIAFAEFEPGDDKQSAPIMWINMGLSQKDAMMLATQQDKVTRICMGLGVPQSMLDASGRTFNNGGLEARNFWTNTILPFLADFEDEINRDLAPRLGPHVAKFDTRHVEDLKAPSKFTTASIGDLVDRKVIFPEEGRTDMGFPAYSPEQLAKIAAAEIGSTMLEQAAYITALTAGGWDSATIATIMGVKAPPKPDPLPAPLMLPPGSVKVKQTPQDYSTTSAVIGLVRELGKEQTRAEQRAATWRQMDAQTRAAEGAWTKAVKRLFARQKKQIIDRLDSRKARWAKSLETRDDPINPDDIFDPTFQEQQTEDALSALFESLVSASGARVAAQHGFGFNVNDPKIQAMIDQRVSKLAEQITGTTYDAIKSVILTGITSGEGIPAIAAGIEAVFAGADATRAELIARTETIAASADGALASYQQGVDAGALDGYGLVWIAELDERCCPACEDLDGEQIAFGDTFSDGEDAPPDHPDAVLSGSTFTPYGELSEMVSAAYQGPAVRIRAGSKSVTIGPNHPMLTARGLIKAKFLREGDQVIYDTRHDRAVPMQESHFQQIPLVEDAFRAFSTAPGHMIVSAPGHDLHGDRVGCQGEIKGVHAARPLLDVPDLAGLQQLRKGDFVLADPNLQLEPAPGGQQLPGQRVMLPTDSCVSRAGPGFGIPAIVATDATQSTGVTGAVAVQTLVAHPHIIALTVDAVHHEWFEGFAFDATTAGLYASNGFVVSNCRCAVGAEPMDPTARTIHAQQARDILRAVASGAVRIEELVA